VANGSCGGRGPVYACSGSWFWWRAGRLLRIRAPFEALSIDSVEADQRRGERPIRRQPSICTLRCSGFAFTAGSRSRARWVHIPRSRPNDLAAESNRLIALLRLNNMDEAPTRDSAAIAGRLEALASALRGGANPFLHDAEMPDLMYGINGFGMNWLAAETDVPDVREVILDRLYDAVSSRTDGPGILMNLGQS
jgi:hypothetical protein